MLFPLLFSFVLFSNFTTCLQRLVSSSFCGFFNILCPTPLLNLGSGTTDSSVRFGSKSEGSWYRTGLFVRSGRVVPLYRFGVHQCPFGACGVVETSSKGPFSVWLTYWRSGRNRSRGPAPLDPLRYYRLV